jgi:hypothetical protein
MMTPQPQEGQMESAKVDVYHAVQLLDRALMHGDGLPAAARKALLDARVALMKPFGPFEASQQSKFSNADVASMVARLKGPGSPGAPKPPPQGAPPAQAGARPPMPQQPPMAGAA